MSVNLDGVGIDNRKPLRIEIQQKFCFSDPSGTEEKNNMAESSATRQTLRNVFHL